MAAKAVSTAGNTRQRRRRRKKKKGRRYLPDYNGGRSLVGHRRLIVELKSENQNPRSKPPLWLELRTQLRSDKSKRKRRKKLNLKSNQSGRRELGNSPEVAGARSWSELKSFRRMHGAAARNRGWNLRSNPRRTEELERDHGSAAVGGGGERGGGGGTQGQPETEKKEKTRGRRSSVIGNSEGSALNRPELEKIRAMAVRLLQWPDNPTT